MVDVFLSYSRHDEAAVRRLAKKIEDEGYEVWWDAELPPHKSYGEVIEEKVASAKAAIVVWSATAAKSEWVRAEADMARNQRKLIQTALGDMMPPLPFNQIQFADIGDWQGEDDHSGWRKVKASLVELCGERGEGAAAAASIAMAAASPAPAQATAPAPTPPPPPAPEPEPVGAEPSKWPLFAGIGIAALAIVGAGAFLLGAMGNGGSGGSETPVLAAAETPEAPASPTPDEAPSPQASSPIPEPEPALPPVQSAAPRGGGADNGAPGFDAAGARRVGCYFGNGTFTYDGPCHFAAGSGGDFMTRSLDGPYFIDVRQIGLDVTSEGRGTLEIYYNGGEIQRTAVQRSSTDRSCWEGPKLTFCAR